MSSIVLSGDTSGTVTVAVPAVAGTNTVTIPAATGTMIYKDSNGVTTLNSNSSQAPLIAQINGTEVMRIASNANVGINTNSPGARLSIAGTSGQATVDVRNEAASDLYYTWGNTGGSAGAAVYVMPIRTGSTATLQGGIYWNGSVLSLAISSDYRLKENVVPLQNGLEKIAQLNPVSYTWKQSGNQGKGFIAHELQAIIPEAVVGQKDAVDENGNIKSQSIDQTQIIVYLTKAIQELNAKVDAQAAEIAALKAGA